MKPTYNPSYNPTYMLREFVRQQGYDPGDVPLSIERSDVAFSDVQPLEADDAYDHPAIADIGAPPMPKHSPRTTGGKES